MGSNDRKTGELAGEHLNERERPLTELTAGSRAVVARVTAPGSPALARRLTDLGFTPGTLVEVLRRAPLRDPVIYRLLDYELCLRRQQAACVHTVAVPE